MDWESLLERYRDIKIAIRLVILAFLAAIYPLYYWVEDEDLLSQKIDESRMEEKITRKKYESYREKVATLTELEEKLSMIEVGLQKAKAYLPDAIALDDLLKDIGMKEKELGVRLVNFEPGQEVRPKADLEYKELPIAISVKADYRKIMQFFDYLVHMKNLTHIREISFKGEPTSLAGGAADGQEEGVVTATASLVLFKGL